MSHHVVTGSGPDEWEVARQCLLDWVGVALAGRGVVTELGLVVDPTAVAGATELVAMRRVGAAEAALVNAAAAHALDFDDVHNDVPGHTGATVVAAALAVAEHEDASLSGVLHGILGGVEAMAALGRVSGPAQYARGWHPTATLGTIGAAVAGSLAQGSSAAETGHAIALAAVQSAGVLASFGTLGKAWQVGCAARSGVHASAAAGAGIRVPVGVLGGPNGVLALLSGDADSAWELQAGPRAAVHDTVFKYYAACFATHGVIACAEALGADPSFHAADVEALTVHVGPQFLSIIDRPAPADETEAKFSASGVVAMTLAGFPAASPNSFSNRTLQDATYRRLEAATTVTVDSALTGADGGLTARRFDGSSWDISRPAPRPGNAPEQWASLGVKFRGLTAAAPREAVDRLVALIRQAPVTTSVRDLVRAIQSTDHPAGSDLTCRT